MKKKNREILSVNSTTYTEENDKREIEGGKLVTGTPFSLKIVVAKEKSRKTPV